jgi:ATP-binding cassette, subfamily B, bacterial
MSIVQGLAAESVDREYSDRELIQRIARYFEPWRGRLVIIVVMLLLRSVFAAIVPVLIAEGLDRLEIGGEQGLLYLLVGVVLLLGVLIWAVNWLQRRLTAMLLGDVVLAMRRDAFDSTI